MKKTEVATRPMGVHIRKVEQRYMKEQRKIEKNYLAQQLPYLLNHIYFCYDEELLTNSHNEKKQYFL